MDYKTIIAGPHSHSTEPQSVVVAGTDRKAVHSAFMNNFWIKGGGLGGAKPEIVERGDEQTFHQSIRLAGPIKEYVFEAVAGERVLYTILSSFPVSTYVATITFETEGDHIRISWKADFTPLIPFTGWVMRYFLANKVFAPTLQHFARKQQQQAKL